MKLIAFILLLSFLGLNVITRADKLVESDQPKLEIVRASDLIKKRSIEKVLTADREVKNTETKKKISKRFGFIPNAGFGVATRLVAVPVRPAFGARIDSGMFNTGGFETGLGNGFGSGLTGGLNGLGGNVGGLSLGGGGLQGLGGNLGAGLDNGGFGLGLRRHFGSPDFLPEDRFAGRGSKTVIVVAPNTNRITNNNALGGSRNSNREVEDNDDDDDEFDREDRRRRRIMSKHFN